MDSVPSSSWSCTWCSTSLVQIKGKLCNHMSLRHAPCCLTAATFIHSLTSRLIIVRLQKQWTIVFLQMTAAYLSLSCEATAVSLQVDGPAPLQPGSRDANTALPCQSFACMADADDPGQHSSSHQHLLYSLQLGSRLGNSRM